MWLKLKPGTKAEVRFGVAVTGFSRTVLLAKSLEGLRGAFQFLNPPYVS